MSRSVLRSLSVVAWLAAAAPAVHADVSAAARAFSDGQAAQLEGNYDRAAQSFELAYSIAPSKEALRSAVRARQMNKQLARAATLAQLLLSQYSDDPISAQLANEVIAEARPKLARISVTCTPRCSLAIGGRAVSLTMVPTHVVFATPGRLKLEVGFEGDRSDTRELTASAGDDIVVPVEAPAGEPAAADAAQGSVRKASSPPLPEHHGLSPMFALSGAVLTVGLTAVTVWSGLDTRRAHDSYVAAPTAQGWNDGRSKQNRTNILLGSAAGVGVLTAAVALFWTRWHGAGTAEVAVVPHSGGLTLSLGGAY